jgi:hypothetical protein
MTKLTVAESVQLTSALSGTSAAHGAVDKSVFYHRNGVLKLGYPQLRDNGMCKTKTKMPVLSLQRQMFTRNALMNMPMFQH